VSGESCDYDVVSVLTSRAHLHNDRLARRVMMNDDDDVVSVLTSRALCQSVSYWWVSLTKLFGLVLAWRWFGEDQHRKIEKVITVRHGAASGTVAVSGGVTE